MRQDEYSMETRVEERGPIKVFIRAASTEAAKGFLATISEREALAAARFGPGVEVVVGRRQGDTLVYPFIGEPTLEQRIGEAIEAGDSSFGVGLVMGYYDFLKKLPVTTCRPTGFFEFLGCAGQAAERAEICLSFAPLDCIPRNLVLGAGGWKVLDLEWTFEFPIPVEFVLWRGLRSLIQGLQPAIQARVGPDAPVVLYSGYGRDRVYMPAAWFREFGVGAMDLEKYAFWERLFREKVLTKGSRRRGRTRLSAHPRIYTTLPRGDGNVLLRIEEWTKRFAVACRNTLARRVL